MTQSHQQGRSARPQRASKLKQRHYLRELPTHNFPPPSSPKDATPFWTLMPDCLVFAELNGKLRSEVPSQQESLFIPWWWIFVWSHDLIECLTEVLVTAQSFGCLFQLLDVFSFCMWDDEGLGLLHWNKSSTKRSAHSVKGTNQGKPREHLSHAIITTKSPSQGWTNHCTNSFTLMFSGKENADSIFLLCKSFALPLSNVTVL